MENKTGRRLAARGNCVKKLQPFDAAGAARWIKPRMTIGMRPVFIAVRRVEKFDRIRVIIRNEINVVNRMTLNKKPLPKMGEGQG